LSAATILAQYVAAHMPVAPFFGNVQIASDLEAVHCSSG
jgi:hypothetical protein